MTLPWAAPTIRAIEPDRTVIERITQAVVEHRPDVLCLACLAAEAGTTEFEIREAAQIAVFRDRLRVERRVCDRCHRVDDVLVPRDA